MNTGLQDAANLAWKLALVAAGDAHDRLLDSVSAERSVIGEQVLRNTGRLTRLAIMRDPILRHIRDSAVGLLGRLPAFRQRLVEAMTELDLHYAQSPLNGPVARGAHVRAGDRAADFAFQHDNGQSGSVADALRGGRFLVLSVGCGDGSPLPLSAAATRLADSVTIRTGSNAYRAGHHYVVRPDGYIAMAAADGDAQAVHQYLGRFQAGDEPGRQQAKSAG
jgi:hypothetical protein